MRERKCKHCKKQFVPQRMGQKACSPQCAVAIAMSEREKRERVADKAKRESLKSRAEWAREAQSAVNAYVRARDAGKPCISCGRHHQGQIHAGHYLSRGAHPELALDERNIHAQCAPCNTYLSGNQLEYRRGLIARYGQAYVDKLEGPHDFPRYDIEDFKRIIKEYRAKKREI